MLQEQRVSESLFGRNIPASRLRPLLQIFFTITSLRFHGEVFNKPKLKTLTFQPESLSVDHGMNLPGIFELYLDHVFTDDQAAFGLIFKVMISSHLLERIYLVAKVRKE